MRRWLLIGLLLGLALAAAILLIPGPWLEGGVVASGLGRLTPLAQPPLGPKAHALLAGAAIAAGLVLGAIAGRVFGRAPPDADTDTDADGAASADASVPPPFAEPPQVATLDTLGWRAPVAPVPEPAPPQIEDSPVPAPALPVAQASVAVVTEEQLVSIPPPAPSGSAASGSLRSADVDPALPWPDPAPALARIEDALAGLAQHGPIGVSARFDALDARLQQIAQQIAEVAALARAAQRTPAQPPVPARSPGALSPPADPVRRHAIAASARALLARMGDDTGSA